MWWFSPLGFGEIISYLSHFANKFYFIKWSYEPNQNKLKPGRVNPPMIALLRTVQAWFIYKFNYLHWYNIALIHTYRIFISYYHNTYFKDINDCISSWLSKAGRWLSRCMSPRLINLNSTPGMGYTELGSLPVWKT